MSVENRQNQPSLKSADRPYLLVVDDDEDQQFLFKFLFENEHDCNVLTASSAEEAEKILDQIHVDLVVCDIRMPRVSGTELVSRLRKSSGLKRLPVISFSADDRLTEQEVLSAGADAFCQKSNRRALSREIRTLLDREPQDKPLLDRVQSRFEQ